jgi:hypothetical protein
MLARGLGDSQIIPVGFESDPLRQLLLICKGFAEVLGSVPKIVPKERQGIHWRPKGRAGRSSSGRWRPSYGPTSSEKSGHSSAH